MFKGVIVKMLYESDVRPENSPSSVEEPKWRVKVEKEIRNITVKVMKSLFTK